MFKRGQVNEQYNWIFALVAGAIILMFFLFVIVQIKTVNDAKVNAKVINNFDAILTGSEASPNTVSIMDSRKSLGFEISCDRDGNSELAIRDSDIKISTSSKIIFAPGTVSGETLYIVVEPIEVPQYIANAILITDSETTFFIYDPSANNPLLQTVEDNMPENITLYKNVRILDILKYSQKLVIISDIAPDLNDITMEPGEKKILRNANVNWIVFDGSSAGFYKKSEKENDFNYLGSTAIATPKQMLYYIFSESPEYYLCNYKKMVKRARNSALIFRERTKFLSNFTSDPRCNAQYLVAYDDFDKMAGETRGPSYDPFATGITNTLEQTNQALLLKSCPLIY